jgi:hypothetical protein
MNRKLWRFIGVVTFLGLVVATIFAQQPVSNTASSPNDVAALITNIRTDQEVLADLVFGGGTRPDTWARNNDATSSSIVADAWYNNEQIADEIFGVATRPDEWAGATSNNAFLVIRNVRHDLELAADQLLGADQRPPAWTGAAKVFRCTRTLQNTLYVLETNFNVVSTTLESVFDYCGAVEAELQSQLVSRALNAETVTPDWAALTLAVRGDLERLADEKLGLNTRPEGWLANKDVASPTLADDNRADLELLAGTLLGQTERPEGWIGQPSNVPALAFRNLRFDLELLADATLGVGVRPRGWQGVDPIQACSPALQDLVSVLNAAYSFIPTVPAESTADTVCADVEEQANLLAENPPLEVAGQGGGEEDLRNVAESRIAFAYLDAAATQFMGEMPNGIRFRAWYRNFSGSTMMFVSGENFAVFIDRKWTTFPQEQFDRLPTLENVKPLTFCDASWCNGPRATPTPTGDVLFDVITAATPPATIAPGQNTDSTGKQLVSWNRIRVTYIAQNSSPGKAQVALEICQEDTQVTCEPVLTILNTLTGVPVPILSSVNGLNVFELPYGYSTNLLIEGTTLFSQDVWLNDPSLTGG